MDATVSARIPVEIRNQSAEILKAIGATQTDLINAAFSFLIAEKQLPTPDTAKEQTKRIYTKGILEQFEADMQKMVLPLPLTPDAEKDYLELRESMADDRITHIMKLS